jgi:hypothetical protein
MSASARLLGFALAVGAAAALVLGVGLGLAQEESVLRWIGYMFSIVGAVTIGFACFSGAPTSARKHVARRLRTTEDEPAAAAVVESKPFVSEIIVLFAAGLLLVAAGTALELLI